MSKAQENALALSDYLRSLRRNIDKALLGSDCEDIYIIGRLRKFARTMGYKLTKLNDN